MAFRPFLRVRLGPDEDPDARHINLIQDNVASALGQLLGKDSLDMKVVQGVNLVPSGINYVQHPLGRPLQGWNVVRTHGTGTYVNVWDVQDAAKAPNLYLLLMASATGTFDLRVY